MRRVTVSLALVVLLLVGLGGLMAREATAHDNLTADHPIVGAWEWDNDPANPGTVLSYAIFHDDGTYIEINTDGSVNIGAWQPTGARTADLTTRTQFRDPETDETLRGTLRMAAEVDASGTQITAPWTFEARTTAGDVVFTGQFTSLGTRIEVMPMVPLGTPVVGTPAS